MAEEYEKERTLEETSTWAVAVVCLVLLVISLSAEHFIHLLGRFLKKRKKVALVEALEKVKSELMLLGFLSLLLTVSQNRISSICISRRVASSWRPCSNALKSSEATATAAATNTHDRRLLEFFDNIMADISHPRRSLATKGYDKCTGEGKYAFVTAYGIHQLHIFIFVLAIMHVIYCIATLILGNIKMRRWKTWEDETRTLEYTYHNDPQRFRFTRDTSFGRRHLHFWSRSAITLRIVCFFRQFYGSVTKVDYLTLRHGFIIAHLSPDNETKFDFQKYIHRTLEEDFKIIVGISPVIWFSAVLFLLTNTHGWHSYYWLPIISLVIVLLIGTKLQVIITKLGLGIQERGQVVQGTPVVQPGDDHFWFGQPRLLLFLIHFVLFQNAFQLAFFAWSTYEFGLKNCFHQKMSDIIVRVSLGILIQVLCSYVTLPLYALVTQMGSSMKTTVFNDEVAMALKQWHHTAKKHAKASKHHGDSSDGTTTTSSHFTTTPLHSTSPIHLLQGRTRASHLDGSPYRAPDAVHEDQYDDLDSQFRYPHDSGEIREQEATSPVIRRQVSRRAPAVLPQEEGSSQEEAEISFPVSVRK